MLLLLLACSNPELQADYDARKTAALADPGPPASGWRAEGALRLSAELLEELIAASIKSESKAAEPINLSGLGTLKPVLTLDRFKLVDGDCKTCIGAEGTLSGNAIIKVAGIKKKIPFTADFTLDMSFETETRANKDGSALRHIILKPSKVRKLKVELSGAGKALDLEKPLKTYGEQVLERIEPVDLGDLGGPELHLRDVRVKEEGGVMRIELLTDAPENAQVRSWPEVPEQGFQVVMSEAALLNIARREAFTLGEVSPGTGIYAEPTSLDLEGQGFEMGLRIWRLDGTDWWRDYTLSGDISILKEELVLKATSVEEGDKSKGAGIADPLALIGEAYIMRILQDSAQGALPGSEQFEVGSSAWNVVLEDAQGVGENLVMSGRIRVGKKGR
jgi:hypothetical protein